MTGNEALAKLGVVAMSAPIVLQAIALFAGWGRLDVQACCSSCSHRRSGSSPPAPG
jgi:hypothetical protein